MRYVIDPTKKFTGAVITSMSDNEHCDYYGNTLEQIRQRDNNPNLITITPGELVEKVNQHLSELHNGPVGEIDEERYYYLFECLPPAKIYHNMFFVGEKYYGDVYTFCFRTDDKFYQCLKRLSTPREQLEREVSEYLSTVKKVR